MKKATEVFPETHLVEVHLLITPAEGSDPLGGVGGAAFLFIYVDPDVPSRAEGESGSGR